MLLFIIIIIIVFQLHSKRKGSLSHRLIFFLIDDDLLEDRVRSAVGVSEPTAVGLDGEVVAVVGSEGDHVASEVLHVELGIAAVVVGVMEVRPAALVASDVVVVVGSDFDDVVVHALDLPHRRFISMGLEVELVVFAVARQSFAVDVELHPSSRLIRRPPSLVRRGVGLIRSWSSVDSRPEVRPSLLEEDNRRLAYLPEEDSLLASPLEEDSRRPEVRPCRLEEDSRRHRVPSLPACLLASHLHPFLAYHLEEDSRLRLAYPPCMPP